MEIDLLAGALSAAAFTGLSRRKIYRLVEEGHLPCVKKGRRLFFRKSELLSAFSGSRLNQRPAPNETRMIIGGHLARVTREPLRHEREANRTTFSVSSLDDAR